MNSTQPSVVDGKAFAIGVLAVTACILFVGFMLVTLQPAQAIGTSDRGGDYKMLTMQLSTSQEGVVVVDAAAKQAIIYTFDYDKKVLEMATAPLDFTQMPKPREAAEAPGQPPAKPPRR